MNDRPTHEEREAMIADEHVGALAPDEAAELALLADLLADSSTWTEPSSGLEDAVVQAVTDAAPPAHASSRAPASGARREVTPFRRRMVLVAAVAAAAAAVAILLGGIVVARTSTSTDFKAQLNATGLAPGAHASADITRNRAGFRVVLDPHDLPVLPAGEYYQAWLKNAAGALVPIGTFSSSNGRVTLWSGVSPKDFPAMSVTIESADNVQASSGRRVLTGEVRAG